MSDEWYFAYGSNLSSERKEKRTGSIRDARLAYLDGYRIAFNKRGTDRTGKANIVPDLAGRVWGVIYRCSHVALEKMDKHEGVSDGHYYRATVTVRLEAGDKVGAVTYVAGKSFVGDSLAPGREYLETILRGAQLHKLPDAYIQEIERAANRDGDRNHGSKHPG